MANHRYWRLHVSQTAGNSQVIVGELAMAIAPGGASVCTGGTASSSSNPNGTDVAAKAFDGITATANYWNSATIATGAAEWLQYDFGGSPRDIVEIRIYYPSDFAVTFAPKNFALYWSDDGVAWTRQRAWAEQAFTLAGTNTYDATPVPSVAITNRRLAGIGDSFKYNAAALPQTLFPTVSRPVGFARIRNFTRPFNMTPFTGKFRIAGTTTVLGLPTARRVDLLEQKSSLIVESRNTAADGVYAFEEIAYGAYTLLGVDNSAEQNSVVYAHVTPVP